MSSRVQLRVVVVGIILAICSVLNDAFVTHAFDTRSNNKLPAILMAKSKVGQTYQEQQELGRYFIKCIPVYSRYQSHPHHSIHLISYARTTNIPWRHLSDCVILYL